MELVKDIYFNTDKLVENTKVKVSYTGKFYQGNNDKVFLHYGYGKDWDNVNEIEMKKTDLGYQAELNLMSSDTLNFCFKNQNNEWDNNFGKNYIFEIEKPVINTELRNPNLVFLGKSFGNKTETQTVSNAYWGSNVTGNTEKSETQNDFSIIGDAALKNTPNSFDTVIPKSTNIIAGNFGKTTQNTTPVNNLRDDNCFKIINPTIDASILNTSNDGVSNNEVINAVEIPVNTNVSTSEPVTENAIALAPTGFNLWTKKIKETVCKFFSYVPKLISGNYKRNLAKNKIQQ